MHFNKKKCWHCLFLVILGPCCTRLFLLLVVILCAESAMSHEKINNELQQSRAKRVFLVVFFNGCIYIPMISLIVLLRFALHGRRPSVQSRIITESVRHRLPCRYCCVVVLMLLSKLLRRRRQQQPTSSPH